MKIVLVMRSYRYCTATFLCWNNWFSSCFVCVPVNKLGSCHIFGILAHLVDYPLTSNRHHLSYDDCLENKGRLQDCSCSIGSYHCIQCYAHILWAAPTGQTDLPLSHWVHFTVLRCICVFVFSCISLHARCIIVTRWGKPGGNEAWSDDWPSSFSALTLLVGSHDL